MADAPVQLILNSERFRGDRDAGGGGDLRDFYKGQDDGFITHRDDLVADLDQILDDFAGQPLIYIRVRMRSDALAKSHRPFGLLFKSSVATHVGTHRYGELIFATTATLLGQTRDLLAAAEKTVEIKPDSAGELRYSPSKARSEASAIASLSVWSSELARSFDLLEGEEWLQETSLPMLRVSTFSLPGNTRDLGVAREAAIVQHERLLSLMQATGVADFANALDALPGVTYEPISTYRLGHRELEPSSINDVGPTTETTIADRRRRLSTQFRELLAELEANGAVREVSLDDDLADPDPVSPTADDDIAPDVRTARGIVGVIDGGVAGYADGAVVGRDGLLADAHRDVDRGLSHGSGIASLIAWGHWFNTYLPEDEACDVYDVDIIPGRRVTHLYYASLTDLLEQIGASVRRAKETSGVRIFNLSYRFRRAPGTQTYSHAAAALDRIALEEDVIFVISAGNHDVQSQRNPWPINPKDVPIFAAGDVSPKGVMSPSDSLTNITVGAVNAPGLFGEIEYAPTRYTPRRAHIPSANKPDLAEVGGAAPSQLEGSNLAILNAMSNRVEAHGTSFAAPLVARKVATLDKAIAGTTSRQTLIAMMLHFARHPLVFSAPSAKKALPYAQEFVGQGIPSPVDDMLEGIDSEMTFVIDDVLLPGKRVQFPIVWPDALQTDDGASTGQIRLTLVYKPVLDPRHGDERVRINLEAALQQAQAEGGFKGQAEATHVMFTGIEHANEKERITALGKWHPVKSYETTMPRGRGESPDWRVNIRYETRAGVDIPDEGIPFTLIITISDPQGDDNVFNEMRAGLINVGARLQDLRTAVRVEASV